MEWTQSPPKNISGKVHWTGLDWTGLDWSGVEWTPVPPKNMHLAVFWVESTGVQWSPYGLWGGQKSTALLGGFTCLPLCLKKNLLDHLICFLCLETFLLLIYFDKLTIGFELLKILRALTDQFIKLKISRLSGLAGLFLK